MNRLPISKTVNGSALMTPWLTIRRAALAVALCSGAALSATVALSEEGDALREDATPFTRGELHAYLAGKTQVWDPNGGAYYAEDGTLQTLWDGVRDSGTWSSTGEGELCWHVHDWGELPCEAYYHNGDVVSYEYQGDTGSAPELQEGNTLEYLQAAFESPASAEYIDPNSIGNLFTPEETAAFVSDKTAILESDGAVYYAPDFTLMTVWNGVRQTGKWSVDGEGGVCWHVAAWGVEPCRYYYFEDGVLTSLYKGLARRAEEFVDGDMTGSP